MTSKRRKVLHQQATAKHEALYRAREIAERKALLKPNLTDEQQEERFRIFKTLALYDLVGSIQPDFGVFNEAYWSKETLQQVKLNAQAMEEEFLKTGEVPKRIF